ncbi:MAG: hypothetical protein KC457_28540, partial [Myxococcales bacterium]|nr:hypothetical protein [Myxococcales bacterium]
PPEPCQSDEFHGCTQESVAALGPCMAGFDCGDFAQAGACHDQLYDGLLACRQEFCPDGPEYWSTDCIPGCDQRRSDCAAVDGCEAGVCDYEWQLCLDTCGICSSIDFSYDYAGSCELTVPGPPNDIHVSYTYVTIDGDKYFSGLSGTEPPALGCDDPDAEGWVWSSETSLTLCEPACQLFADFGTAELSYDTPPCE